MEVKKVKKESSFVIDLNKIPNGHRKPIEVCEFIY